MSERLPQQQDNEEVDLGQLFNAIGRMFEKLFAFIGRILKGILSVIIYALKPIVNNFKLVAIVLGLAAVLGFAAEKFADPVYVSDLVVKPYFDSKYKLNYNVEYYNSLIASKNLKALARVFEIDTVSAKDLIGFEILLGPETQNDILIEYGRYMESIDTSLVKGISFDKYVENRDIYSGSVFSIKAKAKKDDIFRKLQKGIIKTLENDHSKKLKKRSDSIYLSQRENYLEEIQRVGDIQDIYIEIKRSEANRGDISLSSGSLLPLTQEKSATKELELFQEEVKIRNAMRELDEEKYEQLDLYHILSPFDEVGSKHNNISNKYSLTFPLIILGLIMLIFIVLKAFKFIKDYE